MQTLILCYHSQNVVGHAYHENDHLALASDLQAILERQLPVISFNRLLDYLDGRWRLYPRKAVVLTCDDGTLLDWHDYQHPEFGLQPSFDRILQDFLRQAPRRQSTRELMTSFLIASPQARQQIDLGCYGGAPLSNEDWWSEAAASGRWLFGNHSWDHRHICLTDSQGEVGQFYSVDNLGAAQEQIEQASQYLSSKLATKAISPVFAYPYGHSNSFLAEDYLPNEIAKHGIKAAVTTEAGFVTRASNRYLLPRYTCGQHWQSPQQFKQILDAFCA